MDITALLESRKSLNNERPLNWYPYKHMNHIHDCSMVEKRSDLEMEFLNFEFWREGDAIQNARTAAEE